MIVKNGDFFYEFPKVAVSSSQLRPEFPENKAFSDILTFGTLFALI